MGSRRILVAINAIVSFLIFLSVMVMVTTLLESRIEFSLMAGIPAGFVVGVGLFVYLYLRDLKRF